MPIDFEQARASMVEQQVRPWEVLDRRVLATLAALHREDFVPARLRKLAYVDSALPLEHGERMMKPIVEGRMLQALDLEDGEEVLEIGTGSGYITACLAKLARAVVSIDIHTDFIERARARIAELGFSNVELAACDAFAYAPPRAFDAVCVTGAVAEVPQRFCDWLRPGGRLFVIHGASPAQEALRVRRTSGGWTHESLFETDIPYLVGAAPAAPFAL